MGARFLGLAALLVIGCGGSGPSTEEMTGTWHASKIEYISTTGLGTVDIVQKGAGFELELNADKTGVLTFTRVGGHVDEWSGTWSNSIDILKFTISPTNDWTWDMSMSGGTLTLSADGTSWDFNDDGVQEDARWRLVLSKS